MPNLTEAQWILVRLVTIAFNARCVDPYFSDGYVFAERYLYNTIGLRLLTEAMDIVCNTPVPRLDKVLRNVKYRDYQHIADLYNEIQQRGDSASKRDPDMHRTRIWFECINITA